MFRHAWRRSVFENHGLRSADSSSAANEVFENHGRRAENPEILTWAANSEPVFEDHGTQLDLAMVLFVVDGGGDGDWLAPH